MPRALPDMDVFANGESPHDSAGEHLQDRSPHLEPSINGASAAVHREGWDADNQSVNLGGNPADDHLGLLESLGLSPDGAPKDAVNPETDPLRRENLELREIIAELKQALEPKAPTPDPAIAEKQKEFEALLEEKTEIIRALHLKIKESQGHRPASAGAAEDELLALSEELDRERCQMQQEQKQLEDERKQLKDDEQMMTKQLRDMEVQMARERADFARQRSELTRIYEEIRREMENIERNGLLNQRLGQLRQRLHETGAAVGAPPRSGSSTIIPSPRPAATPASENRDPTPPKRRESFIGRIFG